MSYGRGGMTDHDLRMLQIEHDGVVRRLRERVKELEDRLRLALDENQVAENFSRRIQAALTEAGSPELPPRSSELRIYELGGRLPMPGSKERARSGEAEPKPGIRRHQVSFWLDVPAHVSPLGVEDAVRGLVDDALEEARERRVEERLFIDAGDFEVEGAEPKKSGYDAGYSAGYDDGEADGKSCVETFECSRCGRPSKDGQLHCPACAEEIIARIHGIICTCVSSKLDARPCPIPSHREISEPKGERTTWGETQASISLWAEETFGPAGSNVRVAARANEEMAELLRALAVDDADPKAGEEVADIVIVLYRLAARLGVDLHAEIDRKMVKNRSREWKLDGTGHGYHVAKETP